MPWEITQEQLDLFLEEAYFPEISYNVSGMHFPDMFSMYLVLKKLRPDVVIESGVFNGFSTQLIRNTLSPDTTILALDPRDIDTDAEHFIDTNPNTHYYLGSKFIDFNSLDVSPFKGKNILVFFDDHQNQARRLLQAYEKGIHHILFNDNYPLLAGSHYSLEHLLKNDPRTCFDLDSQLPHAINTLEHLNKSEKMTAKELIAEYHIFPNIFPTTIHLMEGDFTCDSAFDLSLSNAYLPALKDADTYTWNTYVRI